MVYLLEATVESLILIDCSMCVYDTALQWDGTLPMVSSTLCPNSSGIDSRFLPNPVYDKVLQKMDG